jgi:phosphohistidine phosphatase
MDDVSGIAGEIKSWEGSNLIAGHLPHLGKLASHLVTGDESKGIVAFQQGGVVCLSSGPDKGWSVVWMLVPEIL